MTRLTTLPDAEAVAQRAAREIAQHLERARDERGVAHLALSGGSTPERTHELLAGTIDDWAGIEVWFADERCVGPEHPDSNYLMVQKTLLDHIAVATPLVHRMEGELGPEQGAERYARVLSERCARASSEHSAQASSEHSAQASSEHSAQASSEHSAQASSDTVALDEEGLPVLDVVVLGIGPDGHVASLFPGAPTLDAGAEAICLGVRDSPKPPPERITLSLAVLRAARRCLLPATGAGKREAIQGALGAVTHDVPASLLRRERLSIFIDDAASPPAPQNADCENL